MNKQQLIGTLALMAALPVGVWARPITYPGGTNVMVGHDPMMDMVHADYTLNKDWALGWGSTYYREMNVSSHGPQVTRGWRWNYPDSQANVYITGGAGPTFVNDAARPSGWGGVSVDWEDRRWFTQAGANFHKTSNGPDYLWQSARVGVAPYIAEAGQLHSWLMVQVDHTPGSRKTWSATPMVRQFYGDYLWEAGVSTRGGVMVNLMKTF
ncbi:MAG TPA: hypothetical protein VHP58_03510 [Alphaproteobacteria bacterium]|nr:hypothetical protein [Alphaproteobacteria bacterium]